MKKIIYNKVVGIAFLAILFTQAAYSQNERNKALIYSICMVGNIVSKQDSALEVPRPCLCPKKYVILIAMLQMLLSLSKEIPRNGSVMTKNGE